MLQRLKGKLPVFFVATPKTILSFQSSHRFSLGLSYILGVIISNIHVMVYIANGGWAEKSNLHALFGVQSEAEGTKSTQKRPGRLFVVAIER